MTFVAIVGAALGFMLLVILHEAGHFAAAKAVGMRVEKFSLFFGPWLWKVKRGETTYGIAAIPLGGYVKITGMNPAEQIPPEVAHRAYYRQPVWKRIVVIAAGPAVNFVLAFLILWGLYATTEVLDTSKPQPPVVDAVNPGTPAAGALRPGDRIVAVDGVRGSTVELRKQLATHKCPGEQVDGCRAAEPASLTIVRAGEEQAVSITPRYNAEEGRPLIGFSFVLPPFKQLGVTAAAGKSVEQMWEVTSKTVSTIAGVFYDKQKRKEVGSVVGMMLVLLLFFIGVTNDIDRLQDGTFDRLR